MQLQICGFNRGAEAVRIVGINREEIAGARCAASCRGLVFQSRTWRPPSRYSLR